jgi:hypothetical protein
MSFVKWLRKNNTKIMAVVVILLMFIFIGGSALQSQFTRRTNIQAVAYFGQKNKITNQDLMIARQELEMLKSLQADNLLRSQDVGGIFLAELLFTEQGTSPGLLNYIRRTIGQNQYRISSIQINDIYRRTVPSYIYWLLLTDEARSAGIRIPNEEVGRLLASAIPQLFNGLNFPQVISDIMARRGIPEKQILSTLGKLLAVLQYAQIICSNEDLTTRQVMNMVDRTEEKIDVEFVQFDSSLLAESEPEPNEAKILEQFNKYKSRRGGFVIKDANTPGYDFGYKLPNRVKIEYIAVKLDDVRTIIKPPTQDQMEEYYSRNKEQQFTEQIRSDPNDPNSEMIDRVKSYAEVANSIYSQLQNDKINSTANSILLEAKTITEAGLEELEIEPGSQGPTAEQLKQYAGDYKTAAEQLSKKYNIKVYSGSTGLLSPVDVQADKYLSMLYLQGYARNPVRLMQIVFAVDDLGISELGPFDVPKPKMYENIGPLKDLASGYRGFREPIMAIVRVTEALKASEPNSINEAFSIRPMILDPNQQEENAVYSVKENVVEDLKQLAAMGPTKSKAEEFVGLTAKDGWDKAMSEFNELFKQESENSKTEPNALSLQKLTDIPRMTDAVLETMIAQRKGDPMAPYIINERRKQGRLVDEMYSLIPQDSNSIEKSPLVMEFKPDMSYYIIKDLSVTRLWKEEYEKIKPTRIFREEHIQTQSLMANHFNPEKILERMNYRSAGEKNAKAAETTADANTPEPAESEAAT